MIVFLDTSVILAASWSAKGLSHVLIDSGRKAGWSLVNAALLWIVLAEVLRNLLIVRGYRGRAALAH